MVCWCWLRLFGSWICCKQKPTLPVIARSDVDLAAVHALAGVHRAALGVRAALLPRLTSPSLRKLVARRSSLTVWFLIEIPAVSTILADMFIFFISLSTNPWSLLAYLYSLNIRIPIIDFWTSEIGWGWWDGIVLWYRGHLLRGGGYSLRVGGNSIRGGGYSFRGGVPSLRGGVPLLRWGGHSLRGWGY